MALVVGCPTKGSTDKKSRVLLGGLVVVESWWVVDREARAEARLALANASYLCCASIHFLLSSYIKSLGDIRRIVKCGKDVDIRAKHGSALRRIARRVHGRC